MKSKHLKELKRLAFEATKKKYPNLPPHAVPQPQFKVSDTNGLTKAVKALVNLTGGFVSRINVQGQYDPKLGKWRQSGADVGVSDLLGVGPDGIGLAIEIKFGKDKLSEKQIQYSERFTKAGGVYFVAKDFDSFFDWYKNFYHVG